MDIDTTSINELPIANTAPQDGQASMNQNGQTSTSQIMIDPQTTQVQQYPQSQEKHVHFSDNITKKEDDHVSKTPSNMDIGIEIKIIILASVMFFLFMDPKIKKYILNILVQIFGQYLKTEHGNFTQIGILVYSMFFGVILMAIVKSIDISSFHLSF